MRINIKKSCFCTVVPFLMMFWPVKRPVRASLFHPNEYDAWRNASRFQQAARSSPVTIETPPPVWLQPAKNDPKVLDERIRHRSNSRTRSPRPALVSVGCTHPPLFLSLLYLGCSTLFCRHRLPMSCVTSGPSRPSATTTWASSSAGSWDSTPSAASTPRPREPSRSSTCSTMFTRASTSWRTRGITLMYTRLEGALKFEWLNHTRVYVC